MGNKSQPINLRSAALKTIQTEIVSRSMVYDRPVLGIKRQIFSFLAEYVIQHREKTCAGSINYILVVNQSVKQSMTLDFFYNRWQS